MDEKRFASWAGLMVLGGFIIGIAGFLAAILAVFNEYDYIGAGLCLLASAIVFGLLANAMLRN